VPDHDPVVGELTGSAAHDLNNRLGAILLFTELLLEDTPATDPRHADLLVIQVAGLEAAAIARRMHAAPCPACKHIRDEREKDP
jgi:signal transduction histidine kinase